MAGCGGMLGEAFYKIFSSNYILKCSDIDVNDNWLSYLDFRDYDKYKKSVLEFKPNYLFHIGAFTDLEYCEKNPQNTKITNTDSVKHAVSIANDLNVYTQTIGKVTNDGCLKINDMIDLSRKKLYDAYFNSLEQIMDQ